MPQQGQRGPPIRDNERFLPNGWRDQFQAARSCGGAHTRDAFGKRNAAWRTCLKREEALKGKAELSQYVKDTLRANAIEDAHKQEVDAADAAYAQAVELPGYQHGDFNNVWFQLELNCRRCFKKGAVSALITVMALSKLPDGEHLGFYGSRPPVPTAIVRTMAAPREAKTHGINPGAALTVAQDGSGWYYLFRPDGRKLSRIRADDKVYLGMVLEVVGFLPDFQAPECNQVQMPPDQDEGPSYTLALKLLAT